MELGVLFAAGSAIWRIVYKFRWLRLWYDDLSAGVAATGCLAMIFLISIACKLYPSVAVVLADNDRFNSRNLETGSPRTMHLGFNKYQSSCHVVRK